MKKFNQVKINWLINHYSKHYSISLKEINTIKRFNNAFIEDLTLLHA